MKLSAKKIWILFGFLALFILSSCTEDELKEAKIILDNNPDIKNWAIEEISKYKKNKTEKVISKKELKDLFWMSGLAGTLKRDDNFEEYIQRLEKNLANNSYIDGIHIAINWNDFEANENKFDFEKLDKVVNLAKKYDKKFKLILMPGKYSPFL